MRIFDLSRCNRVNIKGGRIPRVGSPSCPPMTKRYDPTCVDVCDSLCIWTLVWTRVHTMLAGGGGRTGLAFCSNFSSSGNRDPTDIQHMHIRKRIHAITAPINDHLLPDQIRRMVSLGNRHIPARTPFMPHERIRIRDIARPDVVQCRVAVSAGKDEEMVCVVDGRVGAARWWTEGGCDGGF